MIAAQVGTTAIEHADTLAHVGFTGVSRIVQAVVIFLCVIIILIGIIVMSVGNFTTGLIWFAIGAVAMGGTVFWIRSSSGFYKPSEPVYQPGPIYQPVPRSAYVQPRAPLAQQSFRRPYTGPTQGFHGRGEVSVEELKQMTEVGGDCGCGDDTEERSSSQDDTPTPPTPIFPSPVSVEGDNVIDRVVSPRDVKGAGEAGELFDEAMLNDLTRDGVPRPRKPLTIH